MRVDVAAVAGSAGVGAIGGRRPRDAIDDGDEALALHRAEELPDGVDLQSGDVEPVGKRVGIEPGPYGVAGALQVGPLLVTIAGERNHHQRVMYHARPGGKAANRTVLPDHQKSGHGAI